MPPRETTPKKAPAAKPAMKPAAKLATKPAAKSAAKLPAKVTGKTTAKATPIVLDGVAPPAPDALVQKVLAKPDTPASYAAYADHCTEHRDPLGELVTLSIAADAEPAKERSFKIRAKKALDAYVNRILPDLPGIDPDRLEWRFGLIDAFDTFMWKDTKNLASTIAALIAHPAARFIRHLHLREMNVPDLSGIGKLANLRDLYLWRCNLVGSLAPVANLTLLERFDARRSGISDIRALSACKRLWYVNVEGTDVATLRSLHDVPGLWEVWCQETRVSEDECGALRQALERHPKPKKPNGAVDRRDVYGP